MKMLFKAIMAAAAAFAASATFAQTTALAAPSSVAAPSLKAGVTWTFSRTDLSVNRVTRTREQTLVDATDAGYVLQYRGTDNGNPVAGTMKMDRSLAETEIDGRQVFFMKPAEFPLEVGKRWEARAGSGFLETRQQCTVESFGPVTVKAGTFPAFKIVCPGTYSNSNGANNWRGTTHTVRYYAPELGRVVRIEFSDTTGSGMPNNRWLDQLESVSTESKTADATATSAR